MLPGVATIQTAHDDAAVANRVGNAGVAVRDREQARARRRRQLSPACPPIGGLDDEPTLADGHTGRPIAEGERPRDSSGRRAYRSPGIGPVAGGEHREAFRRREAQNIAVCRVQELDVREIDLAERLRAIPGLSAVIAFQEDALAPHRVERASVRVPNGVELIGPGAEPPRPGPTAVLGGQDRATLADDNGGAVVASGDAEQVVTEA